MAFLTDDAVTAASLVTESHCSQSSTVITRTMQAPVPPFLNVFVPHMLSPIIGYPIINPLVMVGLVPWNLSGILFNPPKDSAATKK